MSKVRGTSFLVASFLGTRYEGLGTRLKTSFRETKRRDKEDSLQEELCLRKNQRILEESEKNLRRSVTSALFEKHLW